MESEHDNLIHNGIGALQFGWLPSPSLRFQVEAAGVKNLSRQPVIIRVPSINFEAEGFYSHVDDTSASGVLNGSPRVGSDADCDEILFQLVNFHEIVGAPVQIGRPGSLGGQRSRLNLTHRDWEIEIDQVHHYGSRLDKVKREGGFALSHVGAIRKTGGGPILVEEADSLLEALHTFLSFSRGSWCTPIFPRGMRDGNIVWEKFSGWKISPWKDVGSWFPRREATGMVESWAGFLDAWNDAPLQYPLKIGTHWYVEANLGAGAIEGSMVLTQTALELLSWVVLVETRGKYSSKEFDGFPAAQKIGLLLAELGIPSSIPSKLGALQVKAQELQVVGGHEILVALRNGIIHPKKAKREAVEKTDVKARWEALQFGLWCVEMSILKLSNYDGVYSNRLKAEWVGEVERVP